MERRAYGVRLEDGKYRAEFHYDDIDLEADTLAGLDSALRAHWHRTWGADNDAGADVAFWAARAGTKGGEPNCHCFS